MLDDLLAQIASLPFESSAAVRLIGRAVAIAEAHNDLDRTWSLRMEAMSRILHSGDWDAIFTHFAWCLAKSDQNPDRFPLRSLMWKYKWVVCTAADTPAVSAPKLLALVDDMEARFKAFGAGQRAVESHRAYALWRLGRREECARAQDQVERHPRDMLSDCGPCEATTTADILAALGQRQAALDRAQHILDGGGRCAEVPHRTFALSLALLREADDIRRADSHHRRGMRVLKNQHKLFESHAQHLLHVVFRGHHAESAGLVERQLGPALANPRVYAVMLYLAATHHAARGWIQHGVQTVAIRLPVACELERGTRCADLAEWAWQSAMDRAAGFDKRNGNDVISRYVEAWRG